MHALLTVFAKEVLENLRARRTLVSALLFGPLFGPILFGAMVSRMLNQGVIESDEPLSITISGGERAPNLERYLESQGVRLHAEALSESAARARVRKDGVLVLLVPAAFAPRFEQARPAPVFVVADSSDSQTRKGADRLHALLAGYASGIAQLMGGLYLAIDCTAGERERGSLESLLSLPVARAALVGGKILATCAYMCLSLAINLAAFVFVFRFVPLERLGMSANLGVGTALEFFAICLPFVPLGAALMTFVASFTRSYREAQTYLTPILLAVIVPP